MASGTYTPTRPPASPGEVERYIERRLHHTRRQMQRVDLSDGLVTLALGALVLLLAAALIDHWLVFGGLGFTGRFVFWLLMMAAGGVFVWRKVVPPLARRINPLYAAHTIEQSRPSLKNSLINFLLFRGHREVVPEVVYHALGDRAARDIAAVPAEAGVDSVRVIRRGYWLAAALAVFCLYLVLSPKNPLVSAARVLLPWASIPAPTRVTIEDVTPGDTARFHGDMVEVSAAVKGVREGEPVLLYYSTSDDQVVNEAIPMLPEGEGNRYRATLPPGSLGLQQDTTYRLVAGDTKSELFAIEVRVAPVIAVESMHYEYPDYTGIADRTTQREGDIRAIAGTKVTIHASANYGIERAEIDLNCTGKPGLRMLAEGTAATGQMTLRMSKDDPARAEFDCYQLRFVDVFKRPNPRPIRHRIEVIPDLPPLVELVEPKQEEITVPLDGQVEIAVTSQDPDFALREVAVCAQCDGKPLKLKPLLSKPRPDKAHAGPFEGKLVFEPRKLALKPGDQVTYWAEAGDNREPEANRAETVKRRIIIAAAEQPQTPPDANQQATARDQSGEGRPGDEKSGDGPRDQQPTERPEGAQQPSDATQEGNAGETQDTKSADAKPSEVGEGKPGEQQPAEPGKSDATGEATAGANGGQAGESADQDQSSEPVDPDTQAGDAIERIEEHRREQQEKQDQQTKQEKPSEGSPAGEKQDTQQGTADSKKGEGSPEKPADASDSNTGQGAAPQQAGDQQQPKPGEPKQGGDEPKPPRDQQNNGQPAGGAQAEPKSSDAKAPNRPDPEKPGSQATDQPGGKPEGQPQPGAQANDGAKSEATQPNAGGKTDPTQAESKPSPTQTGGQPGQPDQPQPGESESTGAGEKSQSGEPATEPNAGVPKGSNAETKPQDTGSAAPQQGTPSPKDDPTGSKPDQTPRSEGQMLRPDQSPGAGQPSDTPSSSPEAQGDNKPRPKEADPSGVKPQEKQEAESPSGSNKESDSKGETDGDLSGGGGKGGGQQGKQPGMGSPGTGTDAASGGAQSNQRGPGEAGTRAGQEVETEQKTGSSTIRREGDGSQQGERQASDRIGKTPLPDKNQTGDNQGTPASDQTGGQIGEQLSDKPGESNASGNPTTGGQESRTPSQPPPPAGEPGADTANLDFARKQTNLALEHLKDQMNKPDSDLLQRLGWTPEDARRFLDKWEQMQRTARETGPQQKTAQRKLDDALRSLGLQRQGTELRGGETPRDRLGSLRENLRFSPPAEWAEQVGEYHRTVAGEK